MSSQLLKKDEFRGPFFGGQVSYITGLDQLGLQNTSEATYTSLLPGITNVTNRIRYFGFYCWLLDQYSEIIGNTDRSQHHNFIRRSELLIALIMQTTAPEFTQIPGSSFAKKLIEESGNTNFDLKSGADHKAGQTSNTYWKYLTGAFGQYYASSMRMMGLITSREDDQQIFIRTGKNPALNVTGLDLANAFSASIPEKPKRLFLKCVKEGKASLNEISSLLEFNMASIPDQSQELECYLNLINDKDSPALIEDTPSFNRKETLAILLDFLGSDPEANWYDFLVSNYQSRGDLTPEENPRFGWYFYQLNEYWQFGCSTIFWAILKHLDLPQFSGQAFLSSFIDDLSRQILNELKDFIPDLKDSTTIEQIRSSDFAPIEEEEELLYLIRGNIKSKNTVQGAANAFSLIFKLLQSNEPKLPDLKTFGQKHQTLRDGNFVNFIEELKSINHLPVKQFIQLFINKYIISRHQFTTIRKMGAGSQSSQKFVLDDPIISLREIVTPQFSMPRLRTLLFMAYDLHLIAYQDQEVE